VKGREKSTIDNKLLNILHLSSAQFLGGGERYLADLANSFSRRGHQVHVVTRPHSPVVDQLSEVPRNNLATLPLRNSLDAFSARRLAGLIKKNRIQIVHAHMARDYPLAAYAVQRNPSARLIVTRHVLFPMNRLHKLTLSRVGRVIAVSDAVGIQLRSEKIVPHQKITVVANGIDADRFAKTAAEFDREKFLRETNLPSDALLVGTVGEIKPLKGQEEFLRAAAQIANGRANVFFIVAGLDGSPRQENKRMLERLTDELGLRARVRFVEWLEDVAKLYAALDVFVSPSRAESFGLAIVEAMASQTAVVSTSTEGAKTTIIPDRTGILVPVGDVAALASKINFLLDDQQARERIAIQAAEDVRKRFSLDRMVDETERIYFETALP
jgi:glycosyltransferase involved in cell wall biosynthesis